MPRCALALKQADTPPPKCYAFVQTLTSFASEALLKTITWTSETLSECKRHTEGHYTGILSV